MKNKHTFEGNQVVLWENKCPPMFIPLWDEVMRANSTNELPENYLNSLSDDDYMAIEYFFLDMSHVG